MMGTWRSFVAVGTMVILACGVAGAQSGANEQELIRSRQQLAAVEGAFERAIANGATMVIDQLRAAMPGWRLTSQPRANGFRLADYGIVFNVQVPDLQPPLRWELQQIVQEPPPDPLTLQRMRTALSTLQGAERMQMERWISEMELRAALGNARVTETGRGSISAASVVPSDAPGGQRGSDPRVLNDPDDSYTREVKAALIDAMLKQTQVLSLGPGEKLSIFVRTSARPDPMFPADSTYLSSWVLTVTGSTLQEFRAGRITEQEALKAVEVREQ